MMFKLAALLGLVLAVLGPTACGGGSQPSLTAFCEQLENAFGPQGALAADYSADPELARAVVDELGSIRKVAPLEIETAMATIIETTDLIIDAFTEPAGTVIDPNQLEKSETAATQLAEYSMSNCGFSLEWSNPTVFVEPDRLPGEVNLEVPG